MKVLVRSSLALALVGCVLPADRVAVVHEDDTFGGSDVPATDDDETGVDDSTNDGSDGSDVPSPDPSTPLATCEGDCPCEGPICNQSCPWAQPGFCDMECPPGALCMQQCEDDFCSSDCFDGAICTEQCFSSCTMGCHGASDCSLDCLGTQSCTMICENTQNCRMGCPAGGCAMHCVGSNCIIEECSFGCTMFCDAQSECAIECGDPESCTIEYL